MEQSLWTLLMPNIFEEAQIHCLKFPELTTAIASLSAFFENANSQKNEITCNCLLLSLDSCTDWPRKEQINEGTNRDEVTPLEQMCY